MATIETLIYLPDTPLRRQNNPIPSQTNNSGHRELWDGARAWRNKPKAQVAEETASFSMETKRIPDPYFYEIGSRGELISPSNQGLVKEVVLRDSWVGELEYQALLRIENWTKGRESGAIAWISPPEENVYPVSKIIVSEIRKQDGRKILFNRAIVLDINEDQCMQFARSLANYSQNKPNFYSKDGVRATPLDLSAGINWTYILEELISGISLKQVRTGEDLILKERAVNQALDIYQQAISSTERFDVDGYTRLAAKSGMVGSKGSSCPPKTAFGAFAENAKEVGINCEKIRCRRCGWEPTLGDEKRMENGELTSCPGKIKGEDGTDKICGWSPGQPV